jgi:tripartite-type tricarboxylate transporter receptor subunit TctC
VQHRVAAAPGAPLERRAAIVLAYLEAFQRRSRICAHAFCRARAAKREEGRMRALFHAALGCLALLSPHAAGQAQTFPERGRAITLIVPYTPGGGVDFVARATAGALERELGVPVPVVNRPGGGAQVGLSSMVRARPDGYTLAMVVKPTVLSHYLDQSRNAGYTRASFQPVAHLYSVRYALAVRNGSPFQDFGAFIAAARANPEGLNVADAGIMTAPHVMLRQLERAAGVRFTSVHFNGGAPAINALVGGHVDAMTGGGSDFVPALRTGQVRVLATTTEAEDPLLPGVPTMRSFGVDLLFATATGIAAPAGTPPDAIAVLEGALRRIAATEAWQQALLGSGITPHFLGARDYAAFWEAYDAAIGPVIRDMIGQ